MRKRDCNERGRDCKLLAPTRHNSLQPATTPSDLQHFAQTCFKSHQEEEEEEEEEEEGGEGLEVAGMWQRQEDVLRVMNHKRDDILVCMYVYVCMYRCVGVSHSIIHSDTHSDTHSARC